MLFKLDFYTSQTVLSRLVVGTDHVTKFCVVPGKNIIFEISKNSKQKKCDTLMNRDDLREPTVGLVMTLVW